MDFLPPPQTLAEGKFLRLVARGHWEYAERTSATGAVTIVAIVDDSRLLLVEQFRIPLGAPAIELPAGLAGDSGATDDTSLADTALRELLEETGYEASEMTPLVAGPTSAGLTSEVIHFFLARGLKRVHAGGGDDHEQIVVHEAPLSGIEQWLADRAASGVYVDPKIFAGLWLAGVKR